MELAPLRIAYPIYLLPCKSEGVNHFLIILLKGIPFGVLFVLVRKVGETMPRGHPKKFNSGSKLIALFREFCDEIIDNGFARVPNQTNFCKWLSDNYCECDRKTIYNALNKYFPTIKSEFEQLQGDVIAEGGMLGKYQSTMSIFALKNWCKWSDKPADNCTEQQEDDNFIDALEGKTEKIWQEE